MNLFLRHLWTSGAGKIVSALQTQQHLHPHQPLKEALAKAGAEIGFCAGAADDAVRALQLDTQQSIGRFRSTELAQLAHAVHRYWRAHSPERRSATPDRSPRTLRS